MEIIYTGEDAPQTIKKSIFLAGPSPRNPDEVESWRKDAIKILEDIGFDEGVVFSPEWRSGKMDVDYDTQIAWEDKHLNMTDCILFWVPRDLSPDSKGHPKMAALTTNIEWGSWATSGKCVFGAPPKAPKNDYIKHYIEKYNVPLSDTLSDTIQSALDKLGEGAERSEAERLVPLYVWNTPSFQSWYKAQTEAGNKLEDARLLYNFRPGFKDFVFLWILQVSIYIASENRSKTNEFVLARPDISSVLLWKREENLADSKVILIKEFRSPASTPDGFIRELTGGSSPKPNEDPLEIAAEEVFEETGFHLLPERLKFHKARQLAGTLSSHKSFLYSVELDDEEVEWFKSQEGIVHGKEEDTERTFLEIRTVSEIIESEETDWTTLGQVLSIIYE